MANRLFVGNLPYETTEAELSQHFSQVGPVSSVFIPLDRETGKPRGFAFIEFGEAGHATAAIQKFHQQPFKERPLVVNEARPSEARPSSPRPAPPRGPGWSGGPPKPPESSESGRAPRRSSPSKPKRRGSKRGYWDDGPKKEPIREKRRNQLLVGFDEGDVDDVDVDFDDFATSLPDDENENKKED